MEGDKRQGNSSSSFTADLFGTKQPAPSSSAGIFSTIFSHPSKMVCWQFLWTYIVIMSVKTYVYYNDEDRVNRWRKLTKFINRWRKQAQFLTKVLFRSGIIWVCDHISFDFQGTGRKPSSSEVTGSWSKQLPYGVQAGNTKPGSSGSSSSFFPGSVRKNHAVTIFMYQRESFLQFGKLRYSPCRKTNKYVVTNYFPT